MSNTIKEKVPGFAVCFLLALPAWFIGKQLPVVGSAVIAILLGMIIALFWKDQGKAKKGIKFTSKYILQTAVVLLGFGMDLGVVLRTGGQSLPIIISTIAISLILAWVLHKAMHIPGNISTLVGVGSSICGGSAIAATAPVIDADDKEVAQAISVICFDTHSGEAFGIFAGTAINDTSSVTAAAATWDSMWNLGAETLNKAVTVKLTRTLAIIPITLGLAIHRARKSSGSGKNNFSLKRAFPMFLLYFVIASVITTLAGMAGVSAEVFAPLKELSKFFITMAMAAIGLNSNLVEPVKSGGKPIALGAVCWAGITAVSLLMQHVMGIW